MDALLEEEEEPALSLLQFGADAIRKNIHHDDNHSMESDNATQSVVNTLGAHNATLVSMQQDQNHTSKLGDVAGSVARKPNLLSSVMQHLEVSSNGETLDSMPERADPRSVDAPGSLEVSSNGIVLDSMPGKTEASGTNVTARLSIVQPRPGDSISDITDTSDFNVAAKLMESIRMAAGGHDSVSLLQSKLGPVVTSTKPLHKAASRKTPAMEKGAAMGSESSEARALGAHARITGAQQEQMESNTKSKVSLQLHNAVSSEASALEEGVMLGSRSSEVRTPAAHNHSVGPQQHQHKSSHKIKVPLQLHGAVSGEPSALAEGAMLGSRAMDVMAPTPVRMDKLGLGLLSIAVVAALAVHLHLRSQLPQSALKKASLSSLSSAEEAQKKAPTVQGTYKALMADDDSTVLDAFGKLVLPLRETWYLEGLADIMKEKASFRILRMGMSGISLQVNISSESSNSGPRRTLEISKGKTPISRLCSSVRNANGQQDEASNLRLSIMDAKYKALGQLRLVTPSHFEFLLNAELIANLDIDDAGQLEITAASGNRMACASYGSGQFGISVNAWTDTGLIISLVLASIILRGGADKF